MPSDLGFTVSANGPCVTHSGNLTLSQTSPSPQYKSFENTVGNGEIAHNEQFLLYPVFSTHLETFLPFSSNSKLSSANSFSLEASKICCLGKG